MLDDRFPIPAARPRIDAHRKSIISCGCRNGPGCCVVENGTAQQEGSMPQYMLLIYPSTDIPPDESRLPLWERFNDDLVSAGAYVTSGRLQGVHSATTVRSRDGETLVSDGPFAETKEYLGGFYLVECADLDAALAHAERMPVLEDVTVEVRPMMSPAGTLPTEMRARAEA